MNLTFLKNQDPSFFFALSAIVLFIIILNVCDHKRRAKMTPEQRLEEDSTQEWP